MDSVRRGSQWWKADQSLPSPNPLSASAASWTSSPRARRLIAFVAAAATIIFIWSWQSNPQTQPQQLEPAYVDLERIRAIDATCRAGAQSASNDFPIAHLISAHHDESIISATLLLQEIYDSGDLFVVHIKAGVEGEHAAVLRRAFASCSNVVFVPDDERVDSGYANFSIIEMELAMIRVALRHSIAWKYALLMDGPSWPAMPTAERREWFKALPAESSQTFYRHPENGTMITLCPDADEQYPKCRRTLSRCLDENCTKVTLTPHGSPIARSWQWNRLSHELAHWIIHSPDMPAWIEFFRPTRTPDEQFFGTVHWASPFREKSDGTDFMYVDWLNTKQCRWWPNPRARQSPCYLSILDMDDIVKANTPFIRKVPSDDQELRRVLPRSTARPTGIPKWHPAGWVEPERPGRKKKEDRPVAGMGAP